MSSLKERDALKLSSADGIKRLDHKFTAVSREASTDFSMP